MNNIIGIDLVVEDDLSETVLRNILKKSCRPFQVTACYGKKGAPYIKEKINGFNNAAKGYPYLVITDLDKTECAPLLINEWLPYPKHNNLIFRIAIREVESWLLAHRKAFAEFLGIQQRLIPLNPDELEDPKRKIIELASKSRKREIREAIVPVFGSTAIKGPDYNGKLAEFVQNTWDVNEAKSNSPSLKRAFDDIMNFNPV